MLQPPTAEAIAMLTGVSTSYAKKILPGEREANTPTAKKVKYCYDAIVDAQNQLVKIVSKVLDGKEF